MTRHDYASEERETYNDRFGDPEIQVGIGERYMRFQAPGSGTGACEPKKLDNNPPNTLY
jgi:hypothetical protein